MKGSESRNCHRRKSAILLERNGKARVIGSGRGSYFLSVRRGPEVCRNNTPLTFRDITVYRVPSGSEFNLKEWKGKVAPATRYR
jgi:hypothetical protein